MRETGIWSLGQEESLEEGMATHSSILAWRIPWTDWWATVQRVTNSWTRLKRLSTYELLISISSVTQSCPTLCNLMDSSILGFPVLHQLLELAQTHVHWVSDAIQPPYPLSSPFLPAFNFPSIRIFSNESVLCIRWPKYWNFSFSISPSNEYSRLISFRIDWFDLLAVQGTLKSLLQYHSSKLGY